MFGIDFSEIVVIFGLALVVLGPEKLPKLAANLGRWMGRARAMARQFREQLETETEGLKSTVADFKSEFQSGVNEVQSSANELSSGVADAQQQISQIGQQADQELKPKVPDSEQHERGV